MHDKVKILKKTLAVFVAASAVISMFVCCLSVNAAVAYNGSGTKSDPFIVETPEQLDGIRNNLSAFYKLGNTIDMSSFGNFSPIGFIAKPFTGSFTCELNADNTPKYIIKNLKVYNDNGKDHKYKDVSGYTNYVKGNSKWEAGLFGCTDGASIENIHILDSSVYNSVIGQHKQNPDGTWNPGADEQGSGILIGMAYNTYVSGCGVTGSMEVRTTSTGGLIGYSEQCIIENCYSKVDVKSGGFWAQSYFIGAVYGGNVTNCYADGSYTFTYISDLSSCGGFVGSLNSGAVLSDCVVTGKPMLSVYGNRCEDDSVTLTNCFADATVSQPAAIPDNFAKYSATNCGITASSGATQPKFNTVGKDAVDAELSTIKAKLSYVTDAAAYTPGAVTEVTVSSQTSAVGTAEVSTATEGDTQTTDADENISVSELIERINALPDSEHITLDDKEEFKKIKKAYDSLSDGEFNQLPAECILKVTGDYEALCLLMMPDIVERIKALPDVKKLTAKDKETVLELYDDYEFLNDDCKAAIASKHSDKLKEAYEKVKDIEDTAVSERALTVSEKVIVVILIVLIVLILAANVTLTIFFFKKKKALDGIDGEPDIEEETRGEG